MTAKTVTLESLILFLDRIAHMNTAKDPSWCSCERSHANIKVDFLVGDVWECLASLRDRLKAQRECAICEETAWCYYWGVCGACLEKIESATDTWLMIKILEGAGE